MVSMGFAALENILYVFQHGVATGITRAFTAVPAHATFAILMGYFMGKAKFSKNKTELNLLGLLVATIFHGAYDFFLFINFIPGIATGAFVSLIIGIVLSKKAIKKHQQSSQFKI
jgi:RsiW-degrading membrane proteinase PrsW (M82 family)